MARKPRKEKLPDNVTSYVDCRGKLRYRWRKSGHRPLTFTSHPVSQEGDAELKAHIAGHPKPGADRYPAGTVGWLAERYFASPAFTRNKNAQTQRTSRLILDKFVACFVKDRVADFRFDHIEAILAKAALPTINAKGRKVGGPHSAANLRTELLPLFAYGMKLLRLATPNPVEQAYAPTVPKGGFHTWSEDEIAQYRAHWPLGTQARLALEIFLWTYQRKGDASAFGPAQLKAGKIEFVASKTGKTMWMDAAPQLLAAIDAMPVVGSKAFLVTRYGKPFSKAGLGNKVREWCDAAGLPQCSAHGLRKAAAVRAANTGASNQQLKALGGWSSDAQVAVYTAGADQRRMANDALAPVIAFDLANSGKTDLANNGGNG